MGKEPSRFFLVRVREQHPWVGRTLTVIATVAAFAVSVALLPFLGFLASAGLIVLSLFLICLWLGVSLGLVKWGDE
jgi:hypothetical protein